MKIFFTLTLVLSVAMTLYSVSTFLRASAHNHYADRHFDLHDTQPRRYDPLPWSLSKEQVSALPENMATPYRQSVEDSYRMASCASSLFDQCFLLALALFVTSVVGLFTVVSAKAARSRSVQPVDDPNRLGGERQG